MSAIFPAHHPSRQDQKNKIQQHSLAISVHNEKSRTFTVNCAEQISKQNRKTIHLKLSRNRCVRLRHVTSDIRSHKLPTNRKCRWEQERFHQLTHELSATHRFISSANRI